MERARVADFYRGKGYQVHESILVTGQSGNQQRVPLLCEGPLGNLAVFFGDAAGIDGPEIGAAKRVARDLGATAVVAAGSFTGEQRRTAAELGVVLLDGGSIESPAPAEAGSAWPGETRRQVLERDLEAHPWPASGRPEGLDQTRRASALSDIDEVVAGAGAALAAMPNEPGPAAPVVLAPAQPATAAAATPVAPMRGDDGGLWRHGRAAAGPRAVAPAAARPGAQRFAWLGLPPAPAPAAEAESTSSVAARPRPAPPSPERVEAERHARLLREAQLRVLVRRGAWILGAALFVYLFLLWWL